jgi:type IV/VI secretion system ImpK/VasF family protein
MSDNTLSYSQRANFCQPFAEFMMQVAVIVQDRRINATELHARSTNWVEKIKKFSQQSQKQPTVAVDQALFAVCAWADELIMNAQWPGVSDQWSQMLLQMKYFNTSLAGEQFFDRMDALTGQSLLAKDVFTFCLANGFKGKFVYDLSIEALELRRQQAASEVLQGVNLINHSAQTFPSLSGQMMASKSLKKTWRDYLPVLISIVCLALFALVLLNLLQLNVDSVLSGWK